jgi:hypothetical protein
MTALTSNPALASESAAEAAETARDERYLEAAALSAPSLQLQQGFSWQ